MKSGLEGRNNVRYITTCTGRSTVSMKSGLEGRNNKERMEAKDTGVFRLNEVRPGRPEQ